MMTRADLKLWCHVEDKRGGGKARIIKISGAFAVLDFGGWRDTYPVEMILQNFSVQPKTESK